MAEKAELQVYTLMVDLGRKAGDGLPEGCDGAAMLCYCAGHSEREAVNETVSVLEAAGMAPLEVESHGTRAEREAEGHVIGTEDAALMERALAENAVIVAQLLPFTDADTDEPDAAPP